MNKTSIEWVKNPDGTQGYTLNPITGCLNSCPYCYARRLANRRLKPLYLANENVAPLRDIDRELYLKTYDGQEVDIRTMSPFYPRFWPERLQEPLGRPKGIFVSDMGELFGDWIPIEWTEKVLKKISLPWYKQHRFYLLTKQPQNLHKFSPFPENCWVGVTATNMRMLADACYMLKRVEAKVKYISLEPFLDFNRTDDLFAWNIKTALVEAGINWLIIGAQTKPYRPPEKESVREILGTADHIGIPVFLKDNLHWPEIRQEMP